MLKDCLEIFEKLYEEHGERLITDSYKLPEGSYVKVLDDGSYEITEIDKKSDDTITDYRYFAVRDYLSKLISMNKPIDKKQIQSNNYLSFFVNKENIESKVTEAIIDGYYKTLAEPISKYKKGNSKKMYEDGKSIYGEVDIEQLTKNKKWIKDKLIEVSEKVIQNKGRIKIFFSGTQQEYYKESQRYIVPNIYNSTDYNINIGTKIYGLPNDNMNLNSKKIFLVNRSRKNKIPYLIEMKEAMLQKKFFDYILNQVDAKKYNIYLNKKEIYALKMDENIWKKNSEFVGQYIRVQKGKEAEIHDFDIIISSNEGHKCYTINNVLNIEFSEKNKNKINYGEEIDSQKLQMLISELYFKKYLVTNYFKEIKDIKLNDGKTKSVLSRYRNGFFTWFYKGDSSAIKNVFKKLSLEVIKNEVMNNYEMKAKEQFNLMVGIMKCLEIRGGEEMADQISIIAKGIRDKINKSITDKITSDQEYAFAVGQITKYYMFKNKSNKKKHALMNPIFNCKSDERLKGELKKLFKKYNYDIESGKKYNNLQSMIFGYEVEEQINEVMLLAGYLYSSLIYETKGE